jgi:hypothetical protein
MKKLIITLALKKNPIFCPYFSKIVENSVHTLTHDRSFTDNFFLSDGLPSPQFQCDQIEQNFVLVHKQLPKK